MNHKKKPSTRLQPKIKRHGIFINNQKPEPLGENPTTRLQPIVEPYGTYINYSENLNHHQ